LGLWAPVFAPGWGCGVRGVCAVLDRIFPRAEVFFPGKLV